MAGVIGAMFNCAIQLGAALGLAIDTSIETSIELEDGADGFQHFRGRRAVLWWLLAAVCTEMVAILVFYRSSRPASPAEEPCYPEAESGRTEKKCVENGVEPAI